MAVLPPERLEGSVAWCPNLGVWLDQRVSSLIAHGQDMAQVLSMPLAPYDAGSRSLIRAELDAAMFHLLGVERTDVDYIMGTFPIVKRKDEAAFGSFRTKELILDAYDAMQAAIETGNAYRSPLEGIIRDVDR